MNFDQAVQFILKAEGGEVNNPNDPGRLTKFGISQSSYPDLNIKLLTESMAADIYKRDYWDKLRLDEMPPEIRLIIFDCAVNQGFGRAARILQFVLGVKQDGLIGEETIQAFKNKTASDLFSKIADMRFDHYSQDVRWPTFGKGWARRLLNIVLTSINNG